MLRRVGGSLSLQVAEEVLYATLGGLCLCLHRLPRRLRSPRLGLALLLAALQGALTHPHTAIRSYN